MTSSKASSHPPAAASASWPPRTNDLVVVPAPRRRARRASGASARPTRTSSSCAARAPGSFRSRSATWRAPAASTPSSRSAPIIRGGTPHFDYVAGETAKGVFQVSLDLDLPVSFGVLTCDTLEQALERSGAKAGNKGFEAAMAAVESADLRARLKVPAAKRRAR